MGLLTFDQIDRADDIRTADVEVPEWGGTVRVRMLSGLEREAFERAVAKDNTRVVSLLAAMTLCDESGKLIYGVERVEAVAKKSASALLRVFKAARDLNRLASEATDAAEGESAAIQSNT